jgi:hypothetical protein
MNMKLIDKQLKKGIHPKFNRLTIISFDHQHTKTGKKFYLCQCDCGNQKVIVGYSVVEGITKSCGCLQKEINIQRSTSHGCSYTITYSKWAGIRNRCLNPNDKQYPNYGGRGIKICNRWLNFENFLEDMGECPEHLEIDRIDNNGDYEPENCRWTTHLNNVNNKRVTIFIIYNGEEISISNAARKYNIRRGALYARIMILKRQ